MSESAMVDRKGKTYHFLAWQEEIAHGRSEIEHSISSEWAQFLTDSAKKPEIVVHSDEC